MAELCLVPDVIIPPKFKVPDFDKYKMTPSFTPTTIFLVPHNLLFMVASSICYLPSITTTIAKKKKKNTTNIFYT